MRRLRADVDEENKKIQAAISRRPDGLCVSALDPATNSQLLDEAIAAKLNVLRSTQLLGPSILLSAGAKTLTMDTSVGSMAEKWVRKVKVAILLGRPDGSRAPGTRRGVQRRRWRIPDIKIVFEQPDNDNLEQAMSVTESALQAHPDLNAILACNASNPIGAARAVKNAGKAGKILIGGFDNLPETLDFVRMGRSCAPWLNANGRSAIGVLIASCRDEQRARRYPQDHDTGILLVTADTLRQAAK